MVVENLPVPVSFSQFSRIFVCHPTGIYRIHENSGFHKSPAAVW
jgi:hypothetical protein